MRAMLVMLLVSGLTSAGEATRPTADEAALAASQTAFACDLYSRIRSEPGNVFLSPYSISTALAMTYAGARSQTAKEMARVLHLDLPPDRVHRGFAAMAGRLNGPQTQEGVKLVIANALWPQSGYTFTPAFLDLCGTEYGVRIQSLDFRGAAEGARRTINSWVEDKTEKKIRELFRPGVLVPDTRLVLTNAIYFKGAWSTPFEPKLTTSEPFHLTAQDSRTVPMMHARESWGYAETEGLQVLDLPYRDGLLSMVVFLPRKGDGLAEFERSLTAENLNRWMADLEMREVVLSLPRFKATGEFDLNQTLIALGMVSAFDARRADFSGMNGNKDLFFSVVVHKAFVEVNEEGTEAAAATGIGLALACVLEAEPPVEFRADHPFFFVIRDRQSGGILFMGRLMDPGE